MHGKDLLRSPGGRKERITPAHAGKRAAPPPRCPGAEDHPRACGEKETDSSIAERNSGSPRVCGEKAFSISCNLSMSGSPPPVRGKGNAVLGVLALTGITPACAGKSRSQAHVTYPPQDHPRLCGEKVREGKLKRYDRGSPPPVRGKAPTLKARKSASRITPACAGKSTLPHSAQLIYPDHPRLCGEKIQRVWAGAKVAGSPPPVRGKVLLRSRKDFRQGITPACAGKRKAFMAAKAETMDHPRVCGEKILRSSSSARPIGSPPRVRGKVPSSTV